MKRFFYAVLSALALIFIGGLSWITIEDIFLDASALVRRSPVIYTVTPNYSTTPPTWILDSVLKGQSDIRFHSTPGTAFTSAPGHFSALERKPDSLFVFCSPRYIFFGPLHVQAVIPVYAGEIPAFNMTYEKFSKFYFPR